MKTSICSRLKIYRVKAIFEYIAAIAGTLTLLISGMILGWPSPSLPKLLDKNSTLVVTNDAGSWVAIMPAVGSLLGCPIVALTVDQIGRKKTIIYSIVLYYVCWVTVAYANSELLLEIGRFIGGVGDGIIYTAVPMYIGEIADPSKRGLLETAGPVAMVIGILLVSVIGSNLSIKVTALASSVIPVMAILSFLWMPESPYYLAMKGDADGAKRSLQILRGSEEVQSELDRLTVAVEEHCSNSGKYLDLFTTKSNRKALLVVLILRAIQKLCGIDGITFYAQTIFKEMSSGISLETYTTVFFTMQVVLMTISCSVVDKVGRRPLIIMSVVGTGLTLFLEGTYFYLKSNTRLDVSSYFFLAALDLIGYVGFFSLGMGTIPHLLLGELFPTNVKAFALCLAEVYFCVIAGVATKTFQILKDSYGMYVPFYLSAACCAVALMPIIMFVPETKGKTLEDIQRQLTGSNEVANAIEINTIRERVTT